MTELICLPGDPRWLEERRKGVTATDIVAIIGLSPYASPFSVYWRKLGLAGEEPDNDRMRLGRALEPYVAERAAAALKPEGVVESGLYRNHVRPWQLATPDRILARNGVAEVLECKTWADTAKDMWRADMPPSVRAQLLWQMDTVDVHTGHAAVIFLPSGEFRVYSVDLRAGEAGRQDIEMLRTAGEDFHAQVLEGIPPAPDASAASLEALKALHANIKSSSRADVDASLWEEYAATVTARRYLEKEARELEIRIRDEIGDAEIIYAGGSLVGKHMRYEVKEHTRRASVTDRIVIFNRKDNQE